MSIIRTFRRWLTHKAGHETIISQAVQAGRDVEAEAKKLHAELDRINKCADPLGELVHSMRTAQFRSQIQQRQG